MQEKRSGPDDEIDVRALVRSLLRAKWWVIGVTVGAALLAYVMSARSNVKTYQAQAMIVFGQSPLNLNVLSTNPSTVNLNPAALPDSKGITDLATLDEIFNTVYQAPALAASGSEDLSFAQIKQESSATLSGTNQLILRVTDRDPARAVLLTNLWAQTLANRINALYGSSNPQITSLEQQVKVSQQAWDAAEKALVDYLPQSHVDSLSVQLAQTQATYMSQLAKMQSIDLILSDGRALSARLAAQQATAPIRAGDALNILELQQRASQVLVCTVPDALAADQSTQTGNPTGNQAGNQTVNQTATCSAADPMQIQLSGTDAFAGLGTVADVQQDLKLLTDSLQAQQGELKTSLDQMDTQLTSLRSQLESAQSKIDQLQTQRDLAKTTFGSLTAQINSTQAEVAANGQVARVAGKAGPARLVPSRVSLNTALGGISGFMVVAVLVWLLEWWRSGGLAG